MKLFEHLSHYLMLLKTKSHGSSTQIFIFNQMFIIYTSNWIQFSNEMSQQCADDKFLKCKRLQGIGSSQVTQICLDARACPISELNHLQVIETWHVHPSRSNLLTSLLTSLTNFYLNNHWNWLLFLKFSTWKMWKILNHDLCEHQLLITLDLVK